MANEIVPYNPNEEGVVIYRTEDNTLQLDVQVADETVWLTQEQMSQLFDRDRTVIGRHIRNIFSEGELDESLVCAKFAHNKKYGRRAGFTKEVETTIYNLDVIISVGYRVKSQVGTRFRQWATKRVIIIDGYIDAATFDMLDVRAKGVTADIYSDGEHKSLRDAHNASKGKQPVNTHKWSKSSHDRWVIIDDTLYHCGHSVKDLGKKLSAIMKMDWNPEVVLKEIR